MTRNRERFYYFNSKTKNSTFECPSNSLSTYIDVVASRHIWLWKNSIFNDLTSEVHSTSSEEVKSSEELNKSIFCKYIRECL